MPKRVSKEKVRMHGSYPRIKTCIHVAHTGRLHIHGKTMVKHVYGSKNSHITHYLKKDGQVTLCIASVSCNIFAAKNNKTNIEYDIWYKNLRSFFNFDTTFNMWISNCLACANPNQFSGCNRGYINC